MRLCLLPPAAGQPAGKAAQQPAGAARGGAPGPQPAAASRPRTAAVGVEAAEGVGHAAQPDVQLLKLFATQQEGGDRRQGGRSGRCASGLVREQGGQPGDRDSVSALASPHRLSPCPPSKSIWPLPLRSCSLIMAWQGV